MDCHPEAKAKERSERAQPKDLLFAVKSKSA
jgi:hypothetical protein